MKAMAPTFRWNETPRMRWRAIGLSNYIRRFVLSCFIFTAVGAILTLFINIRSGPDWWHTHTVLDLILLPVICLLFRVAMELFPGTVRIWDGMLSLNRPLERGYWSLRMCRVVSCVPICGVLRMDVEVPRGGRQDFKKTIMIVVRLKDADVVRSILQANGMSMASPLGNE